MDDFLYHLHQSIDCEPQLLQVFENCYADTLKKAVKDMGDGTYHVITGDIPAMWLRDSAAQMRPYLFAAKKDAKVREIIAGVVRRQFLYICIDAYANAFNQAPNGAYWEKDDPQQSLWVWERKFEIDSLCYPVQLAYLLWKNTGCTSQFDQNFFKGVQEIFRIFRIEQNHEDVSTYRFCRNGRLFQDTLSREGKGALVKPGTGLVWSGFRPSDDACTYGYLIPSNMFIVVIMKYLEEMAAKLFGDTQLEAEAANFGNQVWEAVEREGKTYTEEFGMIYAYETDGFGMYRLMDDANVPIFLQTQPQLYQYVKEDFPEIYEEIKKRVAQGRWETDGGMWVEADCNLTSGESLTRQILIGSRFIKEEFGKDVEYLWLPDVFGYSWALPQILKKSGIDMFMTTKISWNQYNRMPHDTFHWKGMDGSEVLTHFITTPEPWNEPDSWFYTYNGLLTAKTVKGVWDSYTEKEMNKDLLISFGYGDGGGGVNRDLLEQRRRLDKIPGLPNVKNSTAGEYFRKLKQTVKNTTQYVHTWDGELYLEYHRGTYTSQGYNKCMNRKMELFYRKAEWLTAMQAVAENCLETAKQEELTKGWKMILTNQFHDIIPGSSIHEVYEDSRRDYELIRGIGEEVVTDYRQRALASQKDSYVVYNDSGWKQDALAVIQRSGKEPGMFTDEAGEPLLSQQVEDKYYVQVKQLPPMGYQTVLFHKGKEQDENSAFTVDAKHIETPFYSVCLNDYGQITRLYDKQQEREVLAHGERGNVLQVFEDKPLDNDAWDIDIFYQQKMREITDLTAFEVTQCGALCLTVHMEWSYMQTSILQDLTFYSMDRRIDFKTDVDFHERQQLLKAAFTVDIRSTFATYDIQYGNVRRPNHWNTSWDQARFESVGHRFADLSERNYGVALLNDCKYGYDIKDNVMRISLLRSGLQPDHLQDQGRHQFTYALLPHRGDFVEGHVVESAHRLNNPLDVFEGAAQAASGSFFTLDNSQVEIDAVKKSEDGRRLVVRFHDFAGARQKVGLKPSFAYRAWAESDLMERPVAEFTTADIVMELHPYEIKTVLFEF